MSALSSGNVSKYEFLTGKDVLPEKDLLEKAATMKRYEYFLLGKEVKAQTDIAKKQYQKLYNTFEFDLIIKKKKRNQHLKFIINQIEYITVNIVFTNIIVIVKNLIIFLSN